MLYYNYSPDPLSSWRVEAGSGHGSRLVKLLSACNCLAYILPTIYVGPGTRRRHSCMARLVGVRKCSGCTCGDIFATAFNMVLIYMYIREI